MPPRNVKRRQEIADLRKQGMTRREIADHLGISKELVGGYLHQLIQEGTVSRISRQESLTRKAAKNVDVEAARQMRLAGKSFEEIGRCYGVTGSTIKRLIGPSGRITEIQQQLILLRLQGLTNEAIAAKLGKSVGTIGVELSRLVKKGLIPKKRK